MDELSRTPVGTQRLLPREHDGRTGEDVGLRTLISRLGNDVTQFAHDELELAKLELRDVADALRSDIKEAGRTLVKDLVKVGVALSLALMGGLALTAGAVLGIGRLLGDAFWAGGLIVGAVLMIAAAIAVRSAASDTRESEGLRMQNTKRTMREDASVLRDEVRETKDSAKRGAREFKQNATRSDGRSQPQH